MAMQMPAILYQFTILERVLFLPLSETTGLSADKVSLRHKACITRHAELPQIRYVTLLFVSIFLGFFMKYGLHPSRVSGTVRHCYSFLLGLIFGLICFVPL